MQTLLSLVSAQPRPVPLRDHLASPISAPCSILRVRAHSSRRDRGECGSDLALPCSKALRGSQHSPFGGQHGPWSGPALSPPQASSDRSLPSPSVVLPALFRAFARSGPSPRTLLSSSFLWLPFNPAPHHPPPGLRPPRLLSAHVLRFKVPSALPATRVVLKPLTAFPAGLSLSCMTLGERTPWPEGPTRPLAQRGLSSHSGLGSSPAHCHLDEGLGRVGVLTPPGAPLTGTEAVEGQRSPRSRGAGSSFPPPGPR